MLGTATKLNKQINELKEMCFNEFFDIDTVQSIDEKELKLLQLSMNMMDTANELLVEQAELFEAMDMKLDMLINNQSK